MRAQAVVTSPTEGDLRVIFTMDPKIYLPQAVINFFMKRVAGTLIFMLQQQSLNIAADPLRNPIARRIRASSFYLEYLGQRLQDTFAARGWGDLPVSAALGVQAEADGQPLQPVTRRRADKPDRRVVKSPRARREGQAAAALRESVDAVGQGGVLEVGRPSSSAAVRSAALAWGKLAMVALAVMIMMWIMVVSLYTVGLATGAISQPRGNKDALVRICMGIACWELRVEPSLA
jgi:hypothetical protein